MSEIAVRAEKVCKTYRLYDSPSDRLKELLFRRPRHRGFQALTDVSFELARGRALGLIGENGAGKSTLLKIVAGTTQPTSGSVERHGVVASILELGMGFHPEFTGRENARMNAALLGLTGPEIRRRLPEIRDFAELGDFFDRPVRTYSSGMTLRLAFSVATHAQADVLIVDEALAVGDGYFQKKSIDRITEFQKRGGTLLFCSHALYYIALLCEQAIWLKQGLVAAAGSSLTVVRAYEEFLQEKERRRAPETEHAPGAAAGTNGRRPAQFTEVLVHDGSGISARGVRGRRNGGRGPRLRDGGSRSRLPVARGRRPGRWRSGLRGGHAGGAVGSADGAAPLPACGSSFPSCRSSRGSSGSTPSSATRAPFICTT